MEYTLENQVNNTHQNRSLKTRIGEHKRAIRIGDPHNAISVHINTAGHKILWEKNEIVEEEENLQRRRIK